MSLTPKQQQFCHEYLIDLNATAAYQRAGYNAQGRVAEAAASRLLSNVKVQEYISLLRKEQSDRTAITADRVLEEIARVAFAQITDVVTFNGQGIEVKDSLTLSKTITAAVAEVSQVTSERSSRTAVKMHDKLGALKLMMQHLGMLSDFNTAIATLRKYGLNLKQSEGNWIVEVQGVTADSAPDAD